MKLQSPFFMICLFFTGIVFNISCKQHSNNKANSDKTVDQTAKSERGKFDFANPVAKWELPDQMIEISGIVKGRGDTMLAVEDLHPVIYTLLLDSSKGTITDTLNFYETAKEKFDIEDMAVNADTIYALWSHGSIFKIQDYKKNRKVTEFKTGLDKDNNTEGLCIDPVTGNLLIACKNESGLEDEKKSSRSIYEFDTKADTMMSTPFLVIEQKAISNLKGEKIKFFPAAIAIHPVTHDIYIVSTRGTKSIACFSHEGELKSVDMLDETLLLQPEGLSFDTAGNLYISTEGKHGVPPYIYKFAKK